MPSDPRGQGDRRADAPERCAQAFTVAATAVAGGRTGVALAHRRVGLVRPARPGRPSSSCRTRRPCQTCSAAVLAGGTVTLCTQCAARRGITPTTCSGRTDRRRRRVRRGVPGRRRPGPGLLTRSGRSSQAAIGASSRTRHGGHGPRAGRRRRSRGRAGDTETPAGRRGERRRRGPGTRRVSGPRRSRRAEVRLDRPQVPPAGQPAGACQVAPVSLSASRTAWTGARPSSAPAGAGLAAPCRPAAGSRCRR